MVTSDKLVLLTGATGYIGSHAWVELINYGYQVLGVDNFCNSNPKVLDRIKKITGKTPFFQKGDIRDEFFVENIFCKNEVIAVMHFAALKSVGESVIQPLQYYDHNLSCLMTILNAMNKFCKDYKFFVFSSSATVYSPSEPVPYTENMKLGASNPYGHTKQIGEQILGDLEMSDPRWKIACLRYFNPVGAHKSGEIGEDPKGIPSNLMPFISQVAVGRREKISIFGGDWQTRDGTGVRDYIHIVDLAKGHLSALEYLFRSKKSITVNLGTGKGTSVLELLNVFEQVSGRHIPYEIVSRRDGDIGISYADSARAYSLMEWHAKYDLQAMCEDAWRWQIKNPSGYLSN